VKAIGILISEVFFLVSGGCVSTKPEAQTDAPDGFYTQYEEKSSAYTIEVTCHGKARTFGLQHCKVFTPLRAIVFDVPEGCCLQINGRAASGDWTEQPIVLVANHKPYIELSKVGQAVSGGGQRVGPEAVISLVLSTRAEADSIVAALRLRYPLLGMVQPRLALDCSITGQLHFENPWLAAGEAEHSAP
jgi:hypothetical protein